MNDESSRRPVADNFAKRFAPPELYDPKKRREWKLGRHDGERGPYVIELNLQHIEGLPGAIAALDGLLNGLNDDARRPAESRLHLEDLRARDADGGRVADVCS